MPKLALPDVTLLCIDCINHEAAAIAMARSMAHCDFARAVFLADKRPERLPAGAEFVQIEKIGSREAYSRYMLNELGSHVRSSHVLIFQWDGYVLNPDGWRPEFLHYDYIGAKWWHKDGMNVGNGGFSLRSMKLLKAITDLGLGDTDINEDDVICRRHRQDLETKAGIRFADEAVADQFAFERGLEPGMIMPFGFHGLFNMWRVLNTAELHELFSLLHPRTVAYVETVELAVAYQKAKQHEAVLFVCSRILDGNPDQVTALKLLANSALQSGRQWHALVALKELIRVEPANHEYHTTLGDLYARTNRQPEALRCFRRALELKPRDPALTQRVQKLTAPKGA